MESVGAVVIGGDFQGFGVIQSLSEQGIPVFLLDYEWSIGRYSRHVKRFEKNYSLLSLSPETFADYLIDLAKRHSLNGWVLFPNNDETVKLLSINRDRLAGWYRNPVPPWNVVQKIYHKEYAYRIAERLSIPIPKLYRGSNLAELLEEDLQFPIVLKPSFKEIYYRKTRRKAVRADDRETFIREYQAMSSIIRTSEIVVQEMILGGPQNLFSYATFFDGSRAVAGISARRSRQHPMDFGHATTFAESINIPQLESLATRFLKEIGYYGLAEVEFMKDDRDNCYKFLEVNGRAWGWHTLVKASGLNLPLFLFKHMVGQEIGISTPVEGVKWIRLLTDVPTVCRELMSGRMGLRAYFDSLKGRKEFAVLSFEDPLPFLMELIMAPYLWSKRGF